MEFKFKKVFMSGNIISDPIIRELDFLRSQPDARIQYLGQTNPEMFVMMDRRNKAEKELKKLNKKLKPHTKELYEKDETETISEDNLNALAEIGAIQAEMGLLDSNISILVLNDKGYENCRTVLIEFVKKNFKYIFDKLAHEDMSIEDFPEDEDALVTEQLNFVDNYFVK